MFNRGHWKRVEEWPGVDDPTCFPYQEMGDEESYTTDWLTNRCIERLDKTQENPKQPFFMMLSIPDPHTPDSVRPPYDQLHNEDDMNVPENFHDENLASWAKNGGPFKDMDAEAECRVRKHKAAYLGMVSCIDDNVGRILDHLETQGTLDNTIILFTSDHGNYLGEHGLNGKNTMFKNAYNVPFLIRYPQSIPSGTVINEAIDNTDVLPTLCALADIKTSGRESGTDYSAVLQGKEQAQSKRIHQHFYAHENGFSLCGIIDPQWHLILHQDGEHRLFNLIDDPHELHDCFDAHPDIVAELHVDIVAHHQEIGSSALEWIDALHFKPTIAS